MTDEKGNQNNELTEIQFWKKFSRDAISQSISNVEDSGAKIQTGIGLIWTIYTTAAVVGTSIFKPGFPWYINLLIGLPILLIMIAYFFTTKVQVHSVERVDPHNIDFLINSFEKVMLQKKRLLDMALYLMLATTIVIGIAVGFMATFQSSKPQTMQVSEVVINDQKTIGVSGYFSPNAKLDLIIEYVNETKTDIVKINNLTVPSSGNINSSITLIDKPTTYSVTAKWTGDDGLIHSLQKLIKP